MTFVPVIPNGGLTGWAFLKRSMDAQTVSFNASAVQRRDETYFREKIGSISTAEQLVADRRLLGVALGAFGLESDINNRFFIRKVLEEGTLKDGTLANKLANKQYQALSAAFGFGDFSVPRTRLSDFPDRILAPYKIRQFERSVGEQNPDMRLALNARRELTELAGKPSGADTKWYAVMGSPPLRTVFEQAFGLPKSFVSLDLDKQLATLRQRSMALLGNPEIGQFSDPQKTESLIRRFLVRSDTSTDFAPAVKGSAALQILRAGATSSGATILGLLR